MANAIYMVKSIQITKASIRDRLIIDAEVKMNDPHDYFETAYLSPQELSDRNIVFATFVTPNNNNFQIVTKKIKKFAGLDGSFHNWDSIPVNIKRKVLKAPKETTCIRLIYGNGIQDELSFVDNDK